MNINYGRKCLMSNHYFKYYTHTCIHVRIIFTITLSSVAKQVDVLPSKNQALRDLIYNVIING